MECMHKWENKKCHELFVDAMIFWRNVMCNIYVYVYINIYSLSFVDINAFDIFFLQPDAMIFIAEFSRDAEERINTTTVGKRRHDPSPNVAAHISACIDNNVAVTALHVAVC